MLNKKWYNNGTEEKLCFENEIPDGFIPGRLKKEKKIDKLIRIISKEDLFQYYMIENHTYPECKEHFNLASGDINMLCNYYDIHKTKSQRMSCAKRNRTHEQSLEIGRKSSETQKRKWKEKSDKEKLDWSNRCVQSHSTEQARINMRKSQSEARKKLIEENPEKESEMNKRRSETLKKVWSEHKQEIQNKQSETRKLNKKDRICRSIAEQLAFDELSNNFDIQYDICVGNYPYMIDFYIPSLDLYIELQAHPSHGSRPYSKDDKKSIEESYKMYGDWLNTYTIRDTEKLECARKNNIDLIRIYPYSSLEDNFIFNNNKHKNIIELVYNSQHK